MCVLNIAKMKLEASFECHIYVSDKNEIYIIVIEN